MADGDRIPCPMCGSENEPHAAHCMVCGYGLRVTENNQGSTKCARCGSAVPAGYDFCPVCGLDQRRRLARPATQVVGIGSEVHSPDAVPPGAAPDQAPVPAADASGPFPMVDPPANPPVDRTVPAPAHPAPFPHPAPAPVVQAQPDPPAQPSGQPPAQTGRTVFVDGPPLMRPPEPDASAGPGQPPPPMQPPPMQPPAAALQSVSPAVGGRGPDEDAKTIPSMHRARTDESSPTVSIPLSPASQPRSVEDAHPTLDSPMSPYQEPPPNVATYGGAGQQPIPPSSQGTDGALTGGVPRLVVVGRDGEEGEVFPIRGDSVSIGRRQGDLLFPEDGFMSGLHARVERVGDAYTLVDLGSPNGIYKRIRGTSPAFPGDLFMVGHQVLRLENIVESVEEQPLTADGTRLFGTPLKPAWGKLSLIGRGGVPGDTYYLRGAKVVFGREQGDILFPQDPFVSREHARLRLEIQGAAMSVFLEDLGSANGTYIRIRGSAELRARDTFRIGDQILRLRLDR